MVRAQRHGLKARVAIVLALLTLSPAPAPAGEGKPGYPPTVVGEPRTGVLLVASRSVLDPNFAESIILLTDHGKQGSVGLIVNKETAITVASALPDIVGLQGNDDVVLRGGPVSMNSVRLLVHTEAPLPHGINVLENVYLVNSIAILNALVGGDSAGTAVNYYAGYAGWGPGQLEFEIARGDWHLIQADTAMIFTDNRDLLWPKLIEFVSGLWVHNDVISTTFN